jgi:hypothetical protein
MNPRALSRKLIRTAWLGALVVMIPDSARGDATMLVGLMPAGGPRPSVGVACSDCPSVVGFEIKYPGRAGGETADRSCGRDVFASLLVQPPTISAAAAIAQTRESQVSVTAFAGVAMAPGPHPAIGVAVGVKSRQTPVSLEFEDSRSTVGAGFYALLLDHHSSEPNDARNFGGGAKVTLGGPMKLRIDYRAFRLTPIADEDHSNGHRLYVGIVAGF